MTPVAANAAIRLRSAVPEDEDFLFRLYCEVRASEFTLLPLSEEQKTQLIRMQYTAQQAAYQAEFPGSSYEVILLVDEPVGRIWIARTELAFHAVDIGLLPAARNVGIGTWLLKQLQIEARAAGKPIHASVFRFNHGSLRFHQRLGFSICGEDAVQFHLEWSPAGNTPVVTA